MDVLIPPEDYSIYEDYYNAEGLEEHAPCIKAHLKEFSNAFLPIFYSITCVLSIVANLCLLIIFIRYKTLRKTFALNMVISDILFTLTLPFWAVYGNSEWIFGDHWCKAITLVYLISLYSSNLFVASQSFQRFLDVICVASTTRIFSNKKRNAVICILEWFLSVLAAAAHVSFVETQEFHQQKVCSYHFNDKVGWKIYVRFQMIVLGFAVPFLVLLFSSIKLQWNVVRRTTFLKRFIPKRHETGFTVLFFVLWFPYSVVICLHALQDLHIFNECTTNMHLDSAILGTECIAFTHVFLNPLLYAYLNRKIWKRLMDRCRRPTEYLLEESSSSSVMSSQNTIELRSVKRSQAHDLNNSSVERPGNLLPEAT